MASFSYPVFSLILTLDKGFLLSPLSELAGLLWPSLDAHDEEEEDGPGLEGRLGEDLKGSGEDCEGRGDERSERGEADLGGSGGALAGKGRLDEGCGEDLKPEAPSEVSCRMKIYCLDEECLLTATHLLRYFNNFMIFG